MTELKVHEINARMRFVEGPGGWCALHPTRPRVAMAQGEGVYNEARAAAVYDLRHMRTTAAWETVCASQRLYWAGDRVLEYAETAREQASDGYGELIVRELPDGGEVARCDDEEGYAPQVSHDARNVYLPGRSRGVLRELPGLDRVAEVAPRERLLEHWSDAGLHPDGHRVALMREGLASAWQLAVRGFGTGAETSSPWYDFPWETGASSTNVERVSVRWIGPHAVLVALEPPGQGQGERTDRRRLVVLDENDGRWTQRAPIDASVGGPWVNQHDLSPVHGFLAAVTYASATSAMALCVIDPHTGRLKALRPWDANDAAPSGMKWVDANRIAMLSVEYGDVQGLYLWDLRTDTLTRRKVALGAVARRFEYCGFREGLHVLRPESPGGRQGVLLIEDDVR